jgi:hypothetical protein
MRSYIDQTGGFSVPQFAKRVDELTRAISNIGAAAGDGTHTRGMPGYLVRFGEPSGVDEGIEVQNVFFVIVEPDRATVMQGISSDEFARMAEFSWNERWFDGILAAFETFRASIQTT